MFSAKVSRREMIERGMLALPVLVCAAKSARAAAPSCADPTESLRASLHYVEESPDAQKNCSACGFFEPDASAPSCGNCKIFNAPANPKGRCDSWAAKG